MDSKKSEPRMVYGDTGKYFTRKAMAGRRELAERSKQIRACQARRAASLMCCLMTEHT